MSYDLYFARRDGGALPGDAFAAHFRDRPGYTLRPGQAWYTDEDTGVYFAFDRTSNVSDDDDATHDLSFPVVASFNLNYFRPPFFGLEAAAEVAAFVAAFDLVVDDPQMHGMGRGAFSEEGFLTGWNAGNRFAYAAIVAQHGASTTFHALPEAALLATWEWNRRRRDLQATVGTGAFVPRISCFDIEGELLRGAVWPDALPAVLPEVELVVVGRQELAPRRFLVRRPDIVPVRWAVLAAALERFPRGPGPVPCRELLYRQSPDDLVHLVRELPTTRTELRALQLDQVLSAELLEAARADPPAEGLAFAPGETR
jgi:hypothetical protein